MPTQNILIILIINNQKRCALRDTTVLSKHRTVDGSHGPNQGTPLLVLRGRLVVSMDAKPALDAVIVRTRVKNKLSSSRAASSSSLL